MNSWHTLLAEQLKKHGIDNKDITVPLLSLLEDISCAYEKGDIDKSHLEQSLEKITLELGENKHNLQAQIEQAHASSDKLKESVELLQATLDASKEGVVVIDEKAQVEVCNDAILEIFSVSKQELFDLVKENFLKKIKKHVENYDEVKEEMSFLFNNQGAYAQFTLKLSNKKILECFSLPRIINNETVGRVWNIRDVTELKRSERESRYNAYHDRLTGLPNDTQFKERLEQTLKANKDSTQKIAVLFLGLDGFKIVNDSLGREAGDELLKQVSRRLVGILRNEDILCRHAGDEFVLMLNGVNKIKVASQSAERIINVFEEPFNIHDQEISITASIGIALTPNDGDNHAQLTRNSDIAMYHAKSRGRNNYQFFSEGLERLSSHRLKIKNDLKYALENKEFYLMYQPKVSLKNGNIIGVEALIRWKKEGQHIPPMEFIPIAEEYGLIIPISTWVIDTACQQIAKWNQAGFKDMKVAVNLSTRDLESEDMLSIIKGSVERSGISSRNLEIEITETAIMGDINAAIEVLQSMKDYGISVAIDDFGTGYSSLNYLKRLPISLVKIDKSFIDGLSSSKIDYAMVFSIISLAHILGDEVVAEGVEDLETITALKAMSCDYIQGYYYSRPVSPEEITLMLKNDIRLVID